MDSFWIPLTIHEAFLFGIRATFPTTASSSFFAAAGRPKRGLRILIDRDADAVAPLGRRSLSDRGPSGPAAVYRVMDTPAEFIEDLNDGRFRH